MVHTKLRDSTRLSNTYLPIEAYGVIGNLHTVALVGKNGSIDWCCLPRFDAPSVFGALLDAKKGGFFRIAPPDTAGLDRKQMYLPDTNILMTRFLTSDGVAEITDFMPIKQAGSDGSEHTIIRAVQVVRGSLTLDMVCRPAFNYARDTHMVHLSNGGAVFHSETLTLALSATVPLEEDGRGGVHASLTLHTAQSAYFLLASASNHDVVPRPLSDQAYRETFLETAHYWQNWLSHCTYQGRWREMVQRSALVLKLLTYAPTGAMVAAATTSLPESIGAALNWDYRYTWLRDAAFTIYSLLTLGFTQEAEAFMGWLEARCREASQTGSLRPIYTIDGGHDLKEITLDHLEGYRQSRPVRVGNGAYTQQQHDIYGELMDSIFLFDRYKDISYDLWKDLRPLLNWLSAHWQEADAGIWEVRDGPKPFVHSRVMSWVAFDRALRIARHRGLPAPLNAWATLSGQIYEDVMEHGWNDQLCSFVQYYGSDAVDASALLFVLRKFTGPTDPRMEATIDRIQKELTRDSQVYRNYPVQAVGDGMKEQEGTFNMCSFWLAEALARAGRLVEGRLILEKMLTYANHVGLYAEEMSATGKSLGNFPQAFTHLALITACYNMDRALNSASPS